MPSGQAKPPQVVEAALEGFTLAEMLRSKGDR